MYVCDVFCVNVNTLTRCVRWLARNVSCRRKSREQNVTGFVIRMVKRCGRALVLATLPVFASAFAPAGQLSIYKVPGSTVRDRASWLPALRAQPKAPGLPKIIGLHEFVYVRMYMYWHISYAYMYTYNPYIRIYIYTCMSKYI